VATTLRREFEVAVRTADAWAHLAQPSRWPSWAKHIESVDVTPPGEVGPNTVGAVHLSNGITSRFRMTRFEPGVRWTWEGPFLWMHVVYDHAFEPVGEARSKIVFDVAVTGFGSATLGRLFRRLYERNLDRAIPNLVAEIDASRPAGR
jgi:Polyketide cyclase / dehydrase and lipid transport